ncbi:uncharacterized protein O3C94_022588 [Discoglossus pictus]
MWGMSGPGTRCLCVLLLALCTIAVPVLGGAISRRQAEDGEAASPAPDDSKTTPAPGDCKPVKYPCTRVYSVQKPVKQCISYLCVTRYSETGWTDGLRPGQEGQMD